MTGEKFKAIAMKRAEKYGPASKWAEEIGHDIGYSARSMRLFATMAIVPKRAEMALNGKRAAKRRSRRVTPPSA